MSQAKRPAPTKAEPADALTVLLQRAESGDKAVLPVLRKLLESDGWLVEAAGNLATQVQHTLVNNAAGKSLLLQESIPRKMDRLRKDLSGENPTPLEVLLVERVVLCWLSLHDAEVRYAQAKELSIPQATFWQERIDRLHRRYLSAIKTLATIRKLALPALQVNIARKQVNVAAGGTVEVGGKNS